MKRPGFLSKLASEGKLEIVEPSDNMSQAYDIRSGNCLKSAKILFNADIYENSVSEAYYAMYNSVLSLLFKCGIKSENHSAAIILLERLFGLEDMGKILSKAKKERIDKQYYVTEMENVQITKEVAKNMISVSEDFIISLKVHLDKLNASSIQSIRKKFEEELLEPQLRPEYIKKLHKIKKQKGIHFKSVGDLRKEF